MSKPSPPAEQKLKPATSNHTATRPALRELRSRNIDHDLVIDMSDGTQVIHLGRGDTVIRRNIGIVTGMTDATATSGEFER